jgi:late competence protein required for DNA uptake (superfamily II DNA/RNA helicase)
MTCRRCGTELTGTRAYCTAKCRYAFHAAVRRQKARQKLLHEMDQWYAQRTRDLSRRWEGSVTRIREAHHRAVIELDVVHRDGVVAGNHGRRKPSLATLEGDFS